MKGKLFLLVLPAMLAIWAAVKSVNFLFLIILLAILCSFFSHVYRYWQIAMILWSAVFISFYSWTTFVEAHNKTTLRNDGVQVVAGHISSSPKIDGNYVTFQFTLENQETVQVVYYAKSKQELRRLHDLAIGMNCFLQGTLEKPSLAQNFDSFDYRQFLYYKRIHWLLTPAALTSVCKAGQHSLPDRLETIRQSGITYIEKRFDEGTAGIVAALVFGERSLMDEEILEAYQSLGLIHLLAVSGLHVGMITGSVYYLFVRIGITKERSLFLIMTCLPVYIAATGASPSVLRAGLTAWVVACCLRLGLKIHPLDGISIVCLILLFFNPYYLFHIGFQLSFLVSYGLIISKKKIMDGHDAYWKKLAAVTLIAQLISLPVILFYFHEFSLLSLPLNLLYIPLLTLIILPLSFITLLLSFILPWTEIILMPIFSMIIEFSHFWLLKAGTLSFFTIRLGKPSAWILLGLVLSIYYFLSVWESTSLRKGYLPSLLILLVMLMQFIFPFFSPHGTITMLNVGQGDSMLIELPYRKEVILIDTGGVLKYEEERWRERKRTFETGKDVILPYLKARGIRTIDKLIITHSHLDHIGGVEGLIGKVKIKQVLFGKRPIDDSSTRTILKKLHQAGSQIVFVSEGYKWQTKYGQFYVLSPGGHETSENNRSIVLFARIGGLDWLFTGDVETEIENRLLRKYPGLQTDVLKAGHHGSNTSSSEAFLKQLSPKVALISVGRNNRFGHPHPDVLERFQAFDISIYRTDIHGAIRYRFSNKRGAFDVKLSEPQ